MSHILVTSSEEAKTIETIKTLLVLEIALIAKYFLMGAGKFI
jgi:hypothetical protein